MVVQGKKIDFLNFLKRTRWKEATNEFNSNSKETKHPDMYLSFQRDEQLQRDSVLVIAEFIADTDTYFLLVSLIRN